MRQGKASLWVNFCTQQAPDPSDCVSSAVWGPDLTTIKTNRKANWSERLWITHLKPQPAPLQSPENLLLTSVSAGWNTQALGQQVFKSTHVIYFNLFETIHVPNYLSDLEQKHAGGQAEKRDSFQIYPCPAHGDVTWRKE